MPERNGIFDLLKGQLGTRLDELFQRVSEGAALCKRHLQSTGPQVRTRLQNMMRESHCGFSVLRCCTGNHLTEVLGLLPEHHGSGNCRFACIRFANSGNIQRISGQYRIHLVRIVTEH